MKEEIPELIQIALPVLIEAVAVLLSIASAAVWLVILSTPAPV